MATQNSKPKATAAKKTTAAKTVKKSATPKRVPSSKAKANVDQTNKKVVKQKVISHREIKYKYPSDCKDVLARKAFRRKVREKLRKMKAELSDLQGQDRKAMEAKINQYQLEHING